MKNHISVPLTLLDKTLISLSVLIIAGIAIILSIVWSDLPSTVPIHFGFSGEADNYGEKSSLILLLIVMSLVYASVIFSSKLQKNHILSDTNYKDCSLKLYKNDRLMRFVIGLEAIIIMSEIQIKTLLIVFGKINNIGGYSTLITIILIFSTLVFFYLRSQRLKKSN